jgi:protein tyrosine phosphatase (PTP) superfamily phosphohydrolase (DUF442 family)
MKHAQKLFAALAPAAMIALAMTAVACHTPSQCPILQGITGGRIPAPLPRESETYKVIGYRDGIRFYVIQYNDRLYRGGDILSQKGMEALKALGIKTIISVTPTDQERAWAKDYGMKYVEIPFGWYDMKKEHLDRFLAAADAGPAPIFVKCFAGDLRAAILAAHWRIHREGWTFERAIDEYRRLDANYWDSLNLVEVLKANAGKN